MCNILILGTSRLHRPFAKNLNGQLVTNTSVSHEIVFPKIGYFHTAAEMLQAIRFLKNPQFLPKDLRPYIFRIEPRATTPLNEFDSKLEAAIRNEGDFETPFDINQIDFLVLEISSLSVHTHIPSGCVLHTNPNIINNVAYSDIYPEGYYSKFASEMPVAKTETGVNELTEQLATIRVELPNANILVMGHLRSKNHPNAIRDRIHNYLSEASSKSGCIYFDTEPLLDEFGFAVNNGVRDIHHLSDDGEREIGARILSKIYQNNNINNQIHL